MGRIDLDPEHSEAEDAQWWMDEHDSQAYSPELDEHIPVGTIIPGVISHHAAPLSEDVRCAARWTAGRWPLVSAEPRAMREHDVPIRTGAFMRVAVFDHSPSHHTRHIRPVRLEVQE